MGELSESETEDRRKMICSDRAKAVSGHTPPPPGCQRGGVNEPLARGKYVSDWIKKDIPFVIKLY